MFVWRKGCLPWKERNMMAFDIIFPLEMAEYYGIQYFFFISTDAQDVCMGQNGFFIWTISSSIFAQYPITWETRGF